MIWKREVLPQPEGPSIPTTWPFTLPGTTMSRTSALMFLRTGTPSYSRHTFSSLSSVLPRLYSVSPILLALQCQCRVWAQQVLGQSDAIILQKAECQDRELNGKHRRQVKVVVLVEQNGTDSALRTHHSLHHGEHHPAD